MERQVNTSFLEMRMIDLSLERCRLLVKIDVGKRTSRKREQEWRSKIP